MPTPTAKDCHALITYYLKAYESKHGFKPVVNRNKARWAVDNMLQDLTSVEVKGLIDFYMKTSGTHHHSFPWFANHYDELLTSKRDTEADKEAREKLREETRRRTEEWRATQRARTSNSRRETD